MNRHSLKRNTLDYYQVRLKQMFVYYTLKKPNHPKSDTIEKGLNVNHFCVKQCETF